jgi:hypothetical protein
VPQNNKQTTDNLLRNPKRSKGSFSIPIHSFHILTHIKYVVASKIMALLLIEPLLVRYLNKVNITILQDNNCDPTLYNLIKQANLKTRAALSLKVECSVKIIDGGKEGTVKDGRYTVTLLLREWYGYSKPDKQAILAAVKFTKEQLDSILLKHDDEINRDSDIIFGIDQAVGKIYLDFDGSLVCYESTGKIKYYTPDPEASAGSFNVKINNDIVGTHTRNTTDLTYNNYPVYWVGHADQSKTYYIRPWVAVYLTNLIDLSRVFI